RMRLAEALTDLVRLRIFAVEMQRSRQTLQDLLLAVRDQFLADDLVAGAGGILVELRPLLDVDHLQKDLPAASADLGIGGVGLVSRLAQRLDGSLLRF